jgi:cephalosporin-C deacetylase
MPAVDMPLEELKRYTGISPKPQDFDAYWEAALKELDETPPRPELVPAGFEADGAERFDLWFTGVRGARIYAKYLRPKTAGAHACVMAFHGYCGSSGNWSEYLPYVMQGMCAAAMDCRGQGGKSQDVGGVTGNTQRGHIIRGVWDGPQDLYYRHVYLDTVQLYRVLRSFQEVDEARMGTVGESQGGALSTACSALTGAVKRSVIQFPFLTDFKRTWQMDLGSEAYREMYEYFRRFDPMHEREQAFFERLGYIDVHFLAERIQNPALVAIGLIDTICPPSTSFAVYNALPGEKELCLYPDFGHERLPGFGDRSFSYLKEL